jgi:hypothetical protein
VDEFEGKAGRTYEGARPNISAVTATAMTPRKNEIFSRVLTTFVDCQVAASVVMRVDTCTQTNVLVWHLVISNASAP